MSEPRNTAAAAEPLRQLPAVHRILERLEGISPLLARRACRDVLEAERRALLDGTVGAPSSIDAISERCRRRAAELAAPSLRPVLNATGVLLHTNLGRAVLAPAAIEAACRVMAGASNLELDLESGRRGSRQAHVTGLLTELSGAEDALVVNNCAAATLLVLAALCRGREAILSRGELVEIGGGFRVPEVMAESGALLREVGTTNRTRLGDYERALGAQTGLLVKVHRSNFAIVGHSAEVELEELAGLARRAGVPLFYDAGSGSLVPMPRQATLAELVSRGTDVLTVSGDKTLGGPQAGLILGKAGQIAPLRAHPLARAMRADKATIAALEATLRLYRDGRASEVPIVAMVQAGVAELERSGRRMLASRSWKRLRLELVPAEAQLGGGSDPRATLPSVAIALATPGASAEDLKRRLLRCRTPVLARASDDRCLLDLRAILPAELPVLESVLSEMDELEREDAWQE